MYQLFLVENAWSTFYMHDSWWQFRIQQYLNIISIPLIHITCIHKRSILPKHLYKTVKLVNKEHCIVSFIASKWRSTMWNEVYCEFVDFIVFLHKGKSFVSNKITLHGSPTLISVDLSIEELCQSLLALWLIFFPL